VDSDGRIGGLVRENWALLVTIGILLGGAGFLYTQSGSESPMPTANPAVATSGQNAGVPSANQARAVRVTPQEKALNQIAEHEAKVVADPEHEDAPAYLAAMGNLYRQKLVDYEKAEQCYQRLLKDYPDWDGSRVVYMQLATCYERLGKREDALSVYKQMLKVFPDDSQEHAIAHAAVYDGTWGDSFTVHDKGSE